MRHVQPGRCSEHAVQLDEVHLPVAPLVRKQLVAIECRKPLTVRFVLLSKQEVELVYTVNDAVLRNLGTGNSRQGRQYIHHVDDLVADLPCRNLAGPAHHGRYTERAFERGEVVAAPVPRGPMVAFDLFRPVVA